MKRSKSILLTLTLVMMIFSSCAKTPTHTCKITKSFYNGSLFVRFNYSGDQLAEVEQFNSDGSMAEYHILTRNAQGLLYQMDWIEFGQLLERNVVIYNAIDKPLTMYSLNDLNGDGYPEQVNYFNKYVYDADGHLIEIKHYNSVSVYQGSETFVWSGENIARYNLISGNYYTFSYDDQKSIYSSIQWEYFFLMDNPSVLSKNNLMVSNYYNSSDNLLSTNNNTYSYNADGYPESGTLSGLAFSFEYNCVEN